MTPIGILALLIILVVLVAAHEYGHYLFARIFKMDVEEFAVGMGRPRWVLWRKNGTEFSFRAWPLGGFVRIKGMNPEEDGSETQIENGFYSKPAWQRFLVLLAGPVFSLLAGWVVFFVLYLGAGTPDFSSQTRIGEFAEKSAIRDAGAQVGDKIVAINGKQTPTYFEVIDAVRFYYGKDPIEVTSFPLTNIDKGALSVEVERQGKPVTLQVYPNLEPTPSPVFDKDQNPAEKPQLQARLGFMNERVHSPVLAFQRANGNVGEVFHNMKQMFSKPKEIANNVSGPVGIAMMSSQAAASGIEMVLLLAGMLSISLAIINLLPIPPFDGGQMMVALVEMFRGNRRISFKWQNTIAFVGLSLICLMVIGVFTNDILRLGKGQPGEDAKVESKK